MASIYKREWKTTKGENRQSWRVQYLVNGKKRRRDFETERKAKRFSEQVGVARAEDIKKGLEIDSPTLEVFAHQWLSARASGSDGNPALDPETVVWYRGHLANHILPALGQRKLRSLSKSDVVDFRTRLLEGTAVGRLTAKKILTTLRTILSYAVEVEILQVDPSAKVVVRLSSRTRRDVEIHSVENMSTLLRCAAELYATQSQKSRSMWPYYYPMLLILVYCGLRISEARGLDHKDVDLTRKVIRVRQRADRRGRLGAPKSAQGNREVHFPEIVRTVMMPIVQAQRDGLIFRTNSGKPLDANNYRKRCWEHVQRTAKVPVLTLHACRHFFASRQIADGVNPKELAALLGHADEAFTLRVYGHLFKDRATEDRRSKRAEDLVLT